MSGIQDILTARRQESNLQNTLVRDCFSRPAVTIKPRAHIGEAAGLMLAHKLHRLPVTDNGNRLIG